MAASAAVRLLADDDVNVLAVCRRRLLDWGDAARPALTAAIAADDARLRVRARQVVRALDARRWSQHFCRFGARVSAASDAENVLERGVELLAAFDRFDEPPRQIVPRVVELAAKLARGVAGKTSITAARKIAQFLAVERGITGTPAVDQWLPQHMQLDRVIEGRAGLPCALTALYVLVGRRAALRVTPVRLGDYFLVRVHGARPVLIDPFHGGRTVTKADCRRYLRETSAATPAAVRLADASDIELLLCLLAGMSRAYDRADVELYRALQLARSSLFAV